MNTIVENEKTYYVLVVEGIETSVKSESKSVVDLAKSQLPAEKQALAEVKLVSGDGKQVLWG